MEAVLTAQPRQVRTDRCPWHRFQPRCLQPTMLVYSHSRISTSEQLSVLADNGLRPWISSKMVFQQPYSGLPAILIPVNLSDCNLALRTIHLQLTDLVCLSLARAESLAGETAEHSEEVLEEISSATWKKGRWKKDSWGVVRARGTERLTHGTLGIVPEKKKSFILA